MIRNLILVAHPFVAKNKKKRKCYSQIFCHKFHSMIKKIKIKYNLRNACECYCECKFNFCIEQMMNNKRMGKNRIEWNQDKRNK